MAFNQGFYNAVISMGGSAASANNVARASRPGRAFRNFQQAFSVQKAQQDAITQQRNLQRQMQEQQQALLREAMKPGPKATQSLKASNYQPKFKTRGSKAETSRAVSRGTSQFTNPLSMGGGLGGSSINLG
tara:strand:+ start:778 stop:1170 length:393 start_codon:yes stop_codon:yes gene_type:complete